MARLKLAAGDAEDLEVLSARLQDAVFKLKDAIWQSKQRRFAVVVNRLQWEEGGKTRVRASTLFFDQAVDRFFTTLPLESAVEVA